MTTMYDVPGEFHAVAQASAFHVEKEKNPSKAVYKDIIFGLLFVAQVLVVIGLAFSLGILALGNNLMKTVTVVSDTSAGVYR